MVDLLAFLGVEDGPEKIPPTEILQPVRLWTWSEELAAGPVVSDYVSEDVKSSGLAAIPVLLVEDPDPLVQTP